MRKVISGMLALAIAWGLGLTGCGEREQIIVYKDGKYQGKPDGRAWENAPFNGDKTAWETQLKARNQNQNEYTRTQ